MPVSTLPQVKWDEKNRVWYSRAYLGIDMTTGKRVRRRVSFKGASDEAEAQAMSDTHWSNVDRVTGTSCDGTVGGWMRLFLSMPNRPLKPQTLRAYDSAMRNRFPKRFLDKKLTDLTTTDVREWFDDLLDDYSYSTIRCSYALLSNAIETAMRREVVKYNVAKNACLHIPKTTPAGKAFEPGQLDAVRREIENMEQPMRDTLAFAVDMALATGMRVGEICATGPVDYDAELLTLRVQHTVTEATKPPSLVTTKNGRPRNVSVSPAFAQQITRRAEYLRETLGGCVFFVTLDGSMARPSMISHAFTAACRAAGLPSDMSFHNLRHTHATSLLRSKVPVATVSQRLGHSDQSTTLNIYSHVMAGDDEAAALVADKLIQGANDDPGNR